MAETKSKQPDPDYISMHNSTLITSTEHGTDTTQTLKSFKSELVDYVHTVGFKVLPGPVADLGQID